MPVFNWFPRFNLFQTEHRNLQAQTIFNLWPICKGMQKKPVYIFLKKLGKPLVFMPDSTLIFLSLPTNFENVING
jgi:hypothetical protein